MMKASRFGLIKGLAVGILSPHSFILLKTSRLMISNREKVVTRIISVGVMKGGEQ